MTSAFDTVIKRCTQALDADNPQQLVQDILLDAAQDPAIVDAISKRTQFASLNDLVIHRTDRLTLLAGALPAGFYAGPHNHNLWSVVGVCAGQEDNQFFERDGKRLRQIGEASVKAPGVMPNGKDVIHAIRNPLDTPLLVLHAYGGDLFGVARSSWDPETQEEIPFDWKQVSST